MFFFCQEDACVKSFLLFQQIIVSDADECKDALMVFDCMFVWHIFWIQLYFCIGAVAPLMVTCTSFHIIMVIKFGRKHDNETDEV